MAITLDELLGRNRGDAPADLATDRFPSYGEFTARRTRDDAAAYDNAAYGYDYDLDRRPVPAPRSAEAARNYEASRPYRAPREEEYRATEQYLGERRAPVEPDRYGYDGGYERGHEAGGLYEFTRNDAERASGEELYERLSAGAASERDARYAQQARESYASEDYAAKYRAANKSKKKARLGIKAKLIIAAYVVVLAIVGVLIIVNAKPLNNGTAAVPSAEIAVVE